MAALIGALRATLSADTANFEQGMRRAQRQAHTSTTAIGKSLGMVKAGLLSFGAALSVGMLTNVIKSALDYAGGLGEVSQQLGVTTRDLQNFRAVAGQLGVSQAEMDKGLLKLRTTLGQVAAGAKAPTEALRAIGVTVDDLKGKDTGQAFRIIADGLSKVSDSSQRAAVEVALFGRTGAKLDTLLAGGSAAINQLADANERLGGVLSDEQIQKADVTADKLEALKTVLTARIAGVVADNADSILKLANALSDLVGAAARAGGALASFYDRATAGLRRFHQQNPFMGSLLFGKIGRPETTSERLKRITSTKPDFLQKSAGPVGGIDVGQFLGGGGGSRKRAGGSAGPRGKSAEQLAAEEQRRQEKALRDAYQFDQDMRRAQVDVLRAQESLADNYADRTTLAIDTLDKEREIFQAQLDYEVALHKLTKGEEGLSEVQAQQLAEQYEIKDGLERRKLLQDEENKRLEGIQWLTQQDFDRRREELQSQASIATTAKERRQIELELLRLAYRQREQALQDIIDKTKDAVEAENARRDLESLRRTFANAQQNVIANTRGPMEDYFSGVPRTADQTREAMERLKVQGIDGAIESLVSLRHGFESFRDTAINAISAIVDELIRMELKKVAMNLFGQGGDAAQGAAAAPALMTAGTTLTTAGAALSGAGGTLTAAGGTLSGASASLMPVGVGLTTAAGSLTASAAMWTATAAQIQIAAATLMAANAAGSAAGVPMAGGGRVSGPGTGTSDSIPAMLSNGEFVVNAKAARRFLPLLHRINSNGLLGFASGGEVGANGGSLPVAAVPVGGMSEFTAALTNATPIMDKFADALKDAMPGKRGPLEMLAAFASGGLMGLAGGDSGGGGGLFGDSSILKRLPGFATGGAFSVGGAYGRDRNILSVNGLPIAKVSHGERIDISNDAAPMAAGAPFHFHNYAPMSPQQARETGRQAASAFQQRIASAQRAGY